MQFFLCVLMFRTPLGPFFYDQDKFDATVTKTSFVLRAIACDTLYLKYTIWNKISFFSYVSRLFGHPVVVTISLVHLRFRDEAKKLIYHPWMTIAIYLYSSIFIFKKYGLITPPHHTAHWSGWNGFSCRVIDPHLRIVCGPYSKILFLYAIVEMKIGLVAKDCSPREHWIHLLILKRKIGTILANCMVASFKLLCNLNFVRVIVLGGQLLWPMA